MKSMYIVVKGEAVNHKNETDRLNNICSVCYTSEEAYKDAMDYCYHGSRRAQIFKLEADLEVDTVTVTTREFIEERKFTAE